MSLSKLDSVCEPEYNDLLLFIYFINLTYSFYIIYFIYLT